MNMLYKNINANFRIVLDFGMDFDHAKRIVARLAGKVILNMIHDGEDHVKVEYIENGLRNRIRFTKVMANEYEFDFDEAFSIL
ncbi:hypothetical protein D3C85_14530 [compost metagenome]